MYFTLKFTYADKRIWKVHSCGSQTGVRRLLPRSPRSCQFGSEDPSTTAFCYAHTSMQTVSEASLMSPLSFFTLEKGCGGRRQGLFHHRTDLCFHALPSFSTHTHRELLSNMNAPITLLQKNSWMFSKQLQKCSRMGRRGEKRGDGDRDDRECGYDATGSNHQTWLFPHCITLTHAFALRFLLLRFAMNDILIA